MYSEQLETVEKDGERCIVLRAGDVTVALPIEEFVYCAVMRGDRTSESRTYERITEAVILRASGVTNRATAKLLGVTERTVYRWNRLLMDLAP